VQCPACNHIPLAGNQPDPNACPKCGVRYADSLSARKGLKNDDAPPAWDRAEPLTADSAQRIRAGAPTVSPAGRATVRGIEKQYPGAQPVVVVDFQMSFNSMVWFMVKAAIASIPAFIILFVIGAVLASFFGGALLGLR
jgi:hypothetical protein